MPFKDACELICDYLGAGRAYMGKNFSYEAEYKWWQQKKTHNLAMHPNTISFIDMVLLRLKTHNNDIKSTLNKHTLKRMYDIAKY